jgi:hypothetical protein
MNYSPRGIIRPSNGIFYRRHMGITFSAGSFAFAFMLFRKRRHG